MTARLRDLLLRGEINGQSLKDGKQVADLVAEVLLKEALAGNFKALKYLIERNDSRELEEIHERLRRLEGTDGPESDDRDPPPAAQSDRADPGGGPGD